MLGATGGPFPNTIVWEQNYTIWPTNLTATVRSDFGTEYEHLTNDARDHYVQEGGLEKNDLFIAEWVTAAFNENLRSPVLNHLCHSILEFARDSEG